MPPVVRRVLPTRTSPAGCLAAPGRVSARRSASRYWQQSVPQTLPKWQHSSASQQQHVQSLQRHTPLSQQPQQAHAPQPTSAAVATGARASAAQRIKAVMEKLLGTRTWKKTDAATTCRGLSRSKHDRFNPATPHRAPAQAGLENGSQPVGPPIRPVTGETGRCVPRLSRSTPLARRPGRSPCRPGSDFCGTESCGRRLVPATPPTACGHGAAIGTDSRRCRDSPTAPRQHRPYWRRSPGPRWLQHALVRGRHCSTGKSRGSRPIVVEEKRRLRSEPRCVRNSPSRRRRRRPEPESWRPGTGACESCERPARRMHAPSESKPHEPQSHTCDPHSRSRATDPKRWRAACPSLIPVSRGGGLATNRLVC